MPITLADLKRAPLTTALAGACIILTLFRWGGRDVEFLLDDPLVAGTQPWRSVTSMFFHGDVIHLLFNLGWLWLLGSALERLIGRPRLAAMVVVGAYASSSWELAVFHGGIGASGVVYALYAFSWVLRHRPGFENLVTRERTELMVGWFFFCIVATVLGIWAVANVAHGVGALAGLLMGALARWNGPRRLAAAAGLGALVAGGYFSSSVGRAQINLSSDGGGSDAKFPATRTSPLSERR